LKLKRKKFEDRVFGRAQPVLERKKRMPVQSWRKDKDIERKRDIDRTKVEIS